MLVGGAAFFALYYYYFEVRVPNSENAHEKLVRHAIHDEAEHQLHSRPQVTSTQDNVKYRIEQQQQQQQGKQNKW